MRAIITIILLVSLTACCSTVPVQPNRPINIDSRMLEPCKPLVVPKEPLTFESILENTKDNVLVYTDCKTKHDAAIVLLRELTNKKD